MSSDVTQVMLSPEALFGAGSQLASGAPNYMAGDVREVGSDVLFGEGSEIVHDDVVAVSADSLIGYPLFQCLVLASLLFYIIIMLRSWGFMSIMWSGFKNSLGVQRMENEGGKLMVSRFNTMVLLLGIVVVAMVGVRVVDGAGWLSHAGLAEADMMLTPLVSLLIMGVVVAWLYALHHIVEWLSGSTIVSEMASLSVVNFVRCIVLLYPVIAAWLVAPDGSTETWSYVVLALVVLLFLVYLKEGLQLFINKKIPILYWILYLCGVIALPISFAVALLSGE